MTHKHTNLELSFFLAKDRSPEWFRDVKSCSERSESSSAELYMCTIMKNECYVRTMYVGGLYIVLTGENFLGREPR